MDYPFNLKGILYFPKINMEYESIEGTIKLYNNQVFIADNIKEVIPEFLLLLKGVIDCPDLPLNVSRSALQNDGFVKKIAEYITKKVADKLAGMCKTDKEEYDKYWDDISPFIKFGCLKDDKFCEKMNDYILFKNFDGKYLTLKESIEENRKTEAETKGLENNTAAAFTSDNKSDLSTQVAKCQEAGAELVFLPIYYTEASQILTTANKTAYEPIFFGCDGMDGILDVEGFDTSLAEGLMLLTPFAADAQDEKTQAFVSAYVAAYGETPNQFAADAYDVIYSMYQAVLETGVTGDMDASEICEQLKTGYTSMTFDGLTGTGMTWDASGAVSKDPKAVVIKDGAYAAM